MLCCADDFQVPQAEPDRPLKAERTEQRVMMWKSPSGSTSPPIYRRVLMSSDGSRCKAASSVWYGLDETSGRALFITVGWRLMNVPQG
jgi:hypothetical protein